MATEIEHKFLVVDPRWRAQVERSVRMRQGYLVSDAVRSVRVRIEGDVARLNIKSAVVGISRDEYEYHIPLADAEAMLAALCGAKVEKTRHFVHHGGRLWEIDEFEGDNAGLVVAELELEREGEAIVKPDWAGDEVSHELRYYNSQLALHPYKEWRDRDAG